MFLLARPVTQLHSVHVFPVIADKYSIACDMAIQFLVSCSKTTLILVCCDGLMQLMSHCPFKVLQCRVCDGKGV